MWRWKQITNKKLFIETPKSKVLQNVHSINSIRWEEGKRSEREEKNNKSLSLNCRTLQISQQLGRGDRRGGVLLRQRDLVTFSRCKWRLKLWHHTSHCYLVSQPVAMASKTECNVFHHKRPSDRELYGGFCALLVQV